MAGTEISGAQAGDADKPNQQATNTSTNPVPHLDEAPEISPITAPESAESSEEGEGTTTGDEPKTTKRRLFGFGKKRKDDKGKRKDAASNVSDAPRSAPSNLTFVPTTHPYITQSPNRNLHSTSPRVVSPAGSQIFERDVQESASQVPNSPAIPAHIQTEDRIPAVLDASSEAITDNALDPDTVEIVMHSSHQPAAKNVTGISGSEAAGTNWSEDLLAHPDKDDAASNYGALDSADVRRLSFISFADVVQSEQTEHMNNRDPMHFAGLTTLSSGHRSPSPIRSTVSSQGVGTSPPTSKSASIKGLDLSPTRAGKPLASPTLSFPSPTSGSELTIETMSQALRKTASGDLTGTRSQPMSPIGSFEARFP
ncbi:hypothetical protein V493_02264 [Pseudogymnoascus sp. VKM F-4281 (FW-2241)]|nr:hypothetical protein V493_02264 [Pseudogymnoascus sp. VKM F-4281 (FW-2241)]